MNSIEVQSPTRVDLAGGTLDLWPLYNFIGSATTVNVAINVYTKVALTPRDDSRIVLLSKDLNLERDFESLRAFNDDLDPRLKLLRPVFRFWNPTKGFSLVTESQSPVGGGLGGSSSLMVSLMKAFSTWKKKPFSSPQELVHICHNLEAEVLNTPTGTQDYYPAICGGLNILNYTARGITQQVLAIQGTPFVDSFLLVYTGRSHHSGINNFEVVKSAVAEHPNTMTALRELKVIAEEVGEACQMKEWNRLPALFNREFASRVRLAPTFTSPEIEKLQQISMQNGALAVKICGAGGGGCVLVWSKPGDRLRVSEACRNAGFQPMNVLPVDPF